MGLAPAIAKRSVGALTLLCLSALSMGAADQTSTEPSTAPSTAPSSKASATATSQPTATALSRPATAAPTHPEAERRRAPSPPQVRVAVYELRALDIADEVAEVITSSVLAELRKRQGIAAIGMAEIRDMLSHEQNKQLLGCDDDSCLAEIGGALGVDELVTGSVGAVGESSLLNLRRLDLRTARVVRTVDRRLTPAGGEEFLVAIGPAVEELYGEYHLLPGAVSGVGKEVVARLDPPPLPSWIFWTTAGTAAAVALLGGGATIMAGLSYGEANRLAQESVPPGAPIEGSLLQERQELAQRWDIARFSLFAGAGLLVVVCGLEALFTDWRGHPEEAP